MFDKLMLLAHGKVIYFNTKDNAVPYFSSIGYKTPELTNPADYFMYIMSKESLAIKNEDDPEDSAQSQTIQDEYELKIKHFDTNYKNSELTCDVSIKADNVKKLDPDTFFEDMNRNWCSELCLLGKRNVMNLSRLPQTSVLKLFSTIVQSIIVVLLFWNIGKDAKSIQNRRGALFFLSLRQSFEGVNNVVMVFP